MMLAPVQEGSKHRPPVLEAATGVLLPAAAVSVMAPSSGTLAKNRALFRVMAQLGIEDPAPRSTSCRLQDSDGPASCDPTHFVGSSSPWPSNRAAARRYGEPTGRLTLHWLPGDRQHASHRIRSGSRGLRIEVDPAASNDSPSSAASALASLSGDVASEEAVAPRVGNWKRVACRQTDGGIPRCAGEARSGQEAARLSPGTALASRRRAFRHGGI